MLTDTPCLLLKDTFLALSIKLRSEFLRGLIGNFVNGDGGSLDGLIGDLVAHFLKHVSYGEKFGEAWDWDRLEHLLHGLDELQGWLNEVLVERVREDTLDDLCDQDLEQKGHIVYVVVEGVTVVRDVVHGWARVAVL